ncbi:uncharacterized protein LOC143230618 isoform X2 [Tachypleus tridentatus]
MVILQGVTQSDNLALPSTRKELLLVCEKLRHGIGCVDDHMTRCSWGTPEKVFHDVVNGTRQVIQELCLPGPMQEAYLSYAACFKNVSLNEQKCAEKYRTLAELFRKENEGDEDVNKGLRKWCCSYSSFVHCQNNHVAQYCGKQAGIFLRSYMDRMTGPLIHEHCPLYTHGLEACNANTAACNLIWTIFVCFISFLYITLY